MANERPTLSELMAPEPPPVDPYGDLPVLEPESLQCGDVLLMLGVGMTHIPAINLDLPVSKWIRELDGGSYSHAAIVSREGAAGTPMVWDHSHDWKLGPVPVAEAIKGHAWCHVYRFIKDGERLGSERFPADPVQQALSPHRDEHYDMGDLMLAGVVALAGRAPHDPGARGLMRALMDRLADAIERLWGKRSNDHARVCTAVPCIAFWEASNGSLHDYALEIDLDRRSGATLGSEDLAGEEEDTEWLASRNRLHAALPANLREALPLDRPTLAARAGATAWVPAGSRWLNVNLVTPSDLEASHNLKRCGKLAIPEA